MEVELYEGLIFIVPEAPKEKEKILNWDKPQKDQKWTRTEIPENWDYMSIKEQDDFAFEEDRKCTEGIHFWNNGIITYITGDHYHYLNWFKIDSGYPDYRDRDRRWFYHWFMCDNDEDCIGQCYGKLRRDGYSYRSASVILNRARKTFNSNYGIISKTGDDAQEMFFKLIHAFKAYPLFFKPQVKSAEDVKRVIEFNTPQQKITTKTRITKKEISLNTKIEWRATAENTFDGMKEKVLSADEIAKWAVNAYKWFLIAKTCVTLGGKIIGKILAGSTVNEAEKGGAAFKKIWDISSILNKTGNNRTESGLFRYFVPAFDGFEGFIDEYGMSVIETPEAPVMGIDGCWIKIGAKEYLENERKAAKDSGDLVAYYEELRQRPFTESEMFASPANEKTCWDIAKIHQQLEHNAIVMADRTIVQGYFEWANGVRDCGIVEWHPVEKGHHLAKHSFVWLPNVEDRNKFIMKGGKKAPANTHVGLFTLDPYAAVNTVDPTRESKAASHGFKKFDMMSTKERSHAFIGEYWNRLRDPLLVYEDMIMQCVFFGWALLPERNIKNTNDYFRNRDYNNYLLQAPSMTEEDFIKNVSKVQDAGLANTHGKTQNQLVEYLASYIANHVGVNEKTGEMGYMPFDNTLNDWLAFNIDKWTPYDLTISSMVAVVGAQGVTQLKKKEPRTLDIFPKYKYNGNSATRIE